MQQMENGIYKATRKDGSYSYEKIENDRLFFQGKFRPVNELTLLGWHFEEMLVVSKNTIENQNDVILGMNKEMNEIEQILGSALGYPRYVDDPENFPQATAADGVCVGELTTVVIAQQAAGAIHSLKEERDINAATVNYLSIYFVQKMKEVTESDSDNKKEKEKEKEKEDFLRMLDGLLEAIRKRLE